MLLTLIIAVPSAVKVFNWIATLYGGNIRFNSASLFGIGFVSLFISGGYKQANPIIKYLGKIASAFHIGRITTLTISLILR